MKKFLLLILLILSMCLSASAQFVTDIIVTSPDGIWTDSRAYATLNDAITAVGSDERTVKIVSQHAVTTLTVPSNVTLEFARDGSIANSGQLTINTTKIVASNRWIFTGPGNIDFADGTILRSSWFRTIESAFAKTVNDTVTLIVSKSQSITESFSPGNNVTLKWDSPGNILTVNAGVTVGNLKSIEAGNYQIFAGSGDFDFLDGTRLKLAWFNRLRSVLTWVESEEVTIVVSGTNTVSYTQAATANEYFDFVSERGMFTGAVTLTITSPENVIASRRQKIFDSTLTVAFTNPGVVYPGWWGALADGATDDTTAINAAITAVGEGGRIHCPAGDYAIAGTVWMKYKYSMLIGDGFRSTVFVRTGDTGPGIKVAISTEDNTTNGVDLRDFSMSTSGLSSLATYAEIQLNAAHDCSIERVRVQGSYVYTGLEVNGCLRLVINNIIIQLDGTYSAGRNGISFLKRSYGLGSPGNNGFIRLDNSVINTLWLPGDPTGSPMQYAIHMKCMDGFYMTNTRLAGGASANIYLDGTDATYATYSIYHIYISNCFLDFVSGRQIFAAGTNLSEFKDMGVFNCHIQGGTYANQNTYGFEIQTLSNIRFIGNHVENQGTNAMLIKDGVSDIIVGLNNFNRCQMSDSNTQATLTFNGNADGADFVFDGNIINGLTTGATKTSGDGILVKTGATADKIVISDNITKNNNYGIRLSGGGTDVNVVNNIATDNTTEAIRNVLDAVIVDQNWDEDGEVSGTATLVGGTATVTIGVTMPAATYAISLCGDASETFRWSNRTTTQFTITSSNGGSTATVLWTVRMYE